VLLPIKEFAQVKGQNDPVNNPLPVQMIYFRAFPFLNSVVLQWGTATETNNYGYDVERTQTPADSTIPWAVLGFVPGNGNSNSEKHYVFKDTTAIKNNVYYYRLKQIDFDGTPHFTDTLMVEYYYTSVEDENPQPGTFYLSRNYPNPFNPSTNITFSLPTSSDAVISIFNSLGQPVKSYSLYNAAAGEHTLKVDLNNLAGGVYLYRLTYNGLSLVRKMLLLK
jgi:hypothetical protein